MNRRRTPDESEVRAVLQRIADGEPAEFVERLWDWVGGGRSVEWVRRRNDKRVDAHVVRFCGKNKLLALGQRRRRKAEDMTLRYPIRMTDAGRAFLAGQPIPPPPPWYWRRGSLYPRKPTTAKAIGAVRLYRGTPAEEWQATYDRVVNLGSRFPSEDAAQRAVVEYAQKYGRFPS